MYPIQSKGQRGQGGVEYALLLASISLVIIFVSGALFTVVQTQFRHTLCEMDSNGRVQYECNDGVEPGMPIASFTVECPSLSCTIDAVASRDTNSDGTGVIVSYAWDFGDSTSGAGETPAKTYAANGTYTITLVVTDDDGNTASTTRSVYAELPNNAPTASFAVPVCTDLTCSFNAGTSSDSDGSIVSYEWSFGDGNTATGVTASRTYLTSGLRTVTLKVTDNGGKAATTTRSVTPTVPAAMLAHIADLNKTTATSGSNWTATITITVKNGNNVALSGATVYGSFTNGGGSSLTCTTTASGQCTITSQGVAKNGGSAVSNMIFTVNDVSGSLEYYSAANIETSITATIPTNAAPVAGLTVNCTNLVCNFSGAASIDSDGSIADYSWDFGGGGSYTGGSATAASGIYTYSSAGTYTVTLIVTDNLGETDSETLSNPVTAAGNAAPVATINSVNCNLLACTFNGSGTDSDGTVTGYNWNFDGAGSYTAGSATSQTGTYTYSTAGTYTITLTVTDNLTATGSTTTSRTVSLTNTAPVATIDSVNCTNLVCAFSGSGTDSDGTITGYNWNFGGGGSITVGSATAQTGTYTYSAAGTYTITLTVTDNLTATGSTTTSRTVTAAVVNIWIDDVDATGTDGSGNKWTLNTVTFHVRDASNNAVNGAVVSVTDATATTKTCTTGAGGTCTMSGYSILLNSASDSTPLTVNSVTLSGYTYQASSNTNTDGDGFNISNNTITINNPN